MADTTATNNYKDTIIVAYPPGAYGTFLEWCLTYFTGQLPAGQQSWPFVDATGSAHKFRGNHIKQPAKAFQTEAYLTNIDRYIQNPVTVEFARTHADGYAMQEYINTYYNNIKQFVYIRPGPSTLLLMLNNALDKIPNNRFIDLSTKHVQAGAGQWEIRESISFWFNEYPNYLRGFYSVNENCIIVELEDLITNLEQVLDRLINELRLEWSPLHRDTIGELTDTWLRLQKHIHKDSVCQQIITSILGNTEYDWADQKLSLHDEAFVQWALRDLHGLAMKCYNVDVFPTNTTDLRNLLIK